MVLCESLENLKELLSQMAKKHTNTLTLSSTNCSSWQLTGETNLADTMYILQLSISLLPTLVL